MSTKVVVTGATGRMGSTIAGLVMANPEYELAGVVDRPACRKELDTFVCTAGTSLDEVLPQVPDAVVIDFTAPEATVGAARACASHGNPLVAGTTALDKEQLGMLEQCAADAPIMWAPNMSIGVNVLIRILPQLVKALGESYDMDMVELHHNKKKDSPSGTALILADCLAKARDWVLDDVAAYCRHGIIGERPKEEIGIQAIRGGDVVGVHTCYFMGPGERLEVTHQAHSRENFAQGALRAAAWITSQQKGRLFTMADVLFGE